MSTLKTTYSSEKQQYKVDVLIVIPEMSSGGAERVVSNLIEYWINRNLRVAIYSLLYSRDQSFYRLDPRVLWVNDDYVSINHPSSLIRSWTHLRRIRKLIVSLNPRSVLSFLPSANVLSILAATMCDTRVIVSERNCMKKRPIDFKWRVLRFLTYRFSHAVVVNLSSNIEVLARFVPRGKIIYLRNPLKRPAPAAKEDRKRIVLCIGRFTEQKRIDYLVEAFCASDIAKTGWELHLVGYGPLKSDITALAHRLDRYESIKIFEPIADVWDSYWDASILALTSKYEGMPNVLLEAMARGLIPIVTAGVGDLATQIFDCDERLVVPGGDVIVFSRMLREVCEHKVPSGALEQCIKSKIEPYFIENTIVDWDEVVWGTHRS